MKIHVLAGDSLKNIFEQTKIEGEVVVCRECLIDGDVRAESLNDFWQVRENFLNSAYPQKEEKSYQEKVRSEFEKLLNLGQKDEVYLWFEYELFCQTNMWFCLSLLNNTEAQIYRVMPAVLSENEIWKGFGNLGVEDLQLCFGQRIKFTRAEILLGANLWRAFQNKDFAELESLTASESECFPYLREVGRAAIEKEKRPKERIREIISDGETNFGEVFRRFVETEGVYGFGDAQVERIYKEIIR